jgi:hypothetical protein
MQRQHLRRHSDSAFTKEQAGRVKRAVLRSSLASDLPAIAANAAEVCRIPVNLVIKYLQCFRISNDHAGCRQAQRG